MTPVDPDSGTSGDIAIVLGTRPEVIKLADVIRFLGRRARVIATGQHYDHELFRQFFDELGLDAPDIAISAMGGKDRGEQIGSAILALGKEFARQRPRVVIVQGDTNTACAGAQASNYAGIPVIHVEAGLRSYDDAMPEEINRRIIGVLADVHCAPTRVSVDNLVAEGVNAEKILLTGNTIVEATRNALARATSTPETLVPHGVDVDNFVLTTIHRPENTDSPRALRRVLEALAVLDLPVVFATHPRVRQAAHKHGLTELLDRLHPLSSLRHADFLALATRARLLISDSGGLQEECTVIKKPLLVVRRSTERPESIAAGFSRLVTPDDDIAVTAQRFLNNPEAVGRLDNIPCPYGDGTASKQIAAIATHTASAAS